MHKVSARIKLLAIIFFIIIAPVLYLAAADGENRTVVILHSYHQGFKWTDDIAAGISEVLQTYPVKIEVIHEYMDSKRRWDSVYQNHLKNLYAYKYQNMKIDAVIVSDNIAFDYTREFGKDVFPGTPVFFCGVNYLEPQSIKDFPLYTGISEMVDIEKNISLILKLHPMTRQIAFIVDSTETGLIIASFLNRQRQKYGNRLEIRQLTDLTFGELQTEVSRLPDDTVILLSIFFRDRAGKFMEFDESTKQIVKASKVPVYALWDFSLGYGTFGGYLTSGREQGTSVARKVLQYFSGTPVTQIPVRYEEVTIPKFDWSVIQKYKINAEALPSDAVINNRPANIFEQYRELVVGGFALIISMFWLNLILSYLVRKRTSDLHAAKERAETANKSKSQFLANMSHELRTPLNGVIGFTELLMSTRLNQLQLQYALHANTSAHALLGIINNILDFSKIEAGRLELEIAKTDLIKLLEQSMSVVKYTAEKKGLELLLKIPPQMPRFAFVDPVRLGQVIINLLGNAVKFTEKGEVELSVEFVQTDSQNGQYTFAIRDTGIGISPADKNNIFKEFSQADNSATRHFGGTGLGLSISKILVEKMNGTLDMESDPGRGSKFYFSISSVFNHGKETSLEKLKEIKRILIVDDNENNRVILQRSIENWNISTELASSGREAIEKLAGDNCFDAIIMDYMMPELNGIETIRLMRNQLNLTPDKQPIIILYSSCDDVSLHNDCQQLGVFFKLLKPVTTEELFTCLCSLHHHNGAIPPIAKNYLAEPFATIKTLKPVIMIAEDVTMNLLLISELFKKLIPAATIIEAYDGCEAVNKFSENKPDIIFMDIQMPNLDGYDASRQIRKLEATSKSHVPIIALTASAIKGEHEKCIAAGMSDFITKPIDPHKIAEVLKKHLKQNNSD